MAVINITNFGGEMPRLKSRSLPDGAATYNRNLLATSADFRPVMGPLYVAPASATADLTNIQQSPKTLYRRLHDSAGNVRTTDSGGWYAFPDYANIVKGQIVDDTKERTYISYGGTTPPVAADTSTPLGTTYPMGVTPPKQPQVKLNTAAYFTMDKAVSWRDTTLLPTVRDKVVSLLVERNVVEANVWGGYNSLAGLSPGKLGSPLRFSGTGGYSRTGVNDQGAAYNISEPNQALLVVPASQVALSQLDDKRLGGVVQTSGQEVGKTFIAIAAAPTWGRIEDVAALSTALRALSDPRKEAVTLLWSDTERPLVAAGLAAIFDPAAASNSVIAPLRKALDQAHTDFYVAVIAAMATANNRPPVEPLLDSYPGAGNTTVNVGTPSEPDWRVTPNKAYLDYQAAHELWVAAKATWDAKYGNQDQDNAKNISAAITAQAKAASLVAQIEAVYADLKTNLLDTLRTNTAVLGLAKSETNPGGIIEVDGDRIVDSRFYVATFVTSWNEESEPSPVSAMLEVAQNDSVTLMTPAAPYIDGYKNITAVRWYRSNTGSSATAFQFVKEVPIAQTVRAPMVAVGTSGFVGATGTTDAVNTWVDQLASWTIYNAISTTTAAGVYPVPNNDHLQPGDTVTLTNPSNDVVTKKSWNGWSWVSAASTPSAGSIGAKGYVDGLSSAALGEVCPTIDWAIPPSVTTNAVTRYLGGLTGGPNGVMAGFIDNFIAFCVPYTPYAWPVKYQMPIEFPIVGIGAFGQSWFVGTAGNPYIIYGSDPDNYVAQKLDSSQSCVSARSIVASGGGVFYASPDGYCFADLNGVKVITQGLFANEDWRALSPSSIFSVIFDNVLYFWYEGTGQGRGCYGYDPMTGKLTSHDIPATAVCEDVVTDGVYGAWGGSVYKLFYDNSPNANARMTGKWYSGSKVLPAHSTMAWLKVWGDLSAAVPAKVNIWVQDTLLCTVNVTSTNPVRLPVMREIEYIIGVESKARITAIQIVGNTAELKGIE